MRTLMKAFGIYVAVIAANLPHRAWALDCASSYQDEKSCNSGGCTSAGKCTWDGRGCQAVPNNAECGGGFGITSIDTIPEYPSDQPSPTSGTLEPNSAGCPSEEEYMGMMNGPCRNPGLVCRYGEECCCGECGHSFQLECMADMSMWVGLNTDRCMMPEEMMCPDYATKPVDFDDLMATCRTLETCEECLAAGCAMSTHGYMCDAMCVMDAPCYQASPQMDAQAMCKQREIDSRDEETCTAASDCRTCTGTTKSNGESCLWFGFCASYMTMIPVQECEADPEQCPPGPCMDEVAMCECAAAHATCPGAAFEIAREGCPAVFACPGERVDVSKCHTKPAVDPPEQCPPGPCMDEVAMCECAAAHATCPGAAFEIAREGCPAVFACATGERVDVSKCHTKPAVDPPEQCPPGPCMDEKAMCECAAAHATCPGAAFEIAREGCPAVFACPGERVDVSKCQVEPTCDTESGPMSGPCPMAKCMAPPEGCGLSEEYTAGPDGTCCPKMCHYVDANGRECNPGEDTEPAVDGPEHVFVPVPGPAAVLVQGATVTVVAEAPLGAEEQDAVKDAYCEVVSAKAGVRCTCNIEEVVSERRRLLAVSYILSAWAEEAHTEGSAEYLLLGWSELEAPLTEAIEKAAGTALELQYTPRLMPSEPAAPLGGPTTDLKKDAEDTPAEDTPAEDTPAEDTPAEDTPAEESPTAPAEALATAPTGAVSQDLTGGLEDDSGSIRSKALIGTIGAIVAMAMLL